METLEIFIQQKIELTEQELRSIDRKYDKKARLAYNAKERELNYFKELLKLKQESDENELY